MQKYGDIGTKERHARHELITTDVAGQPRTQVKHKSPIETYYNKGQLTMSQRAAGEALYRFWTNGWVGFNSCEYREPIDGGKKDVTMTEKQVEAQRKYKLGMGALARHEDRYIVEKVCVDESFISQLYTHWYPRKKAKARLYDALQKIAKVYNYA